MSKLPSQPLGGTELIQAGCHLYKVSFLTVFPFSILILLIAYFIHYGDAFVPTSVHSQFQQIAMFLAILWIPLFSLIIAGIDAISKGYSPSYFQLITLVTQRFLSLVGSFISTLLIPAILLAIGTVGYFILLQKQLNHTVLYLWKGGFSLLILAVFTPKIFTPILVISNLDDANSAIDNSETLVKGYYFRTFLHLLYSIFFIVFLGYLPLLIMAFSSLPLLPLEALSGLLLSIFIPWPIAILLIDKNDLELRKKLKKSL